MTLYAKNYEKSGGFIDCRISKIPCFECDHVDWLCRNSHDGSACICMRVESDRPMGKGWFHRYEDEYTRPNISMSLIDVDKPPVEKMSLERAEKLQGDYLYRMTAGDYELLSTQQGVSEATLRAFGAGVGWDGSKEVWTFPQRLLTGEVCGFRTMSREGDRVKMAIKGSKSSSFFVPEFITREYIDLCSYVLVCEGFTDAQIAFELGFKSVIGRSNCTGELHELIDLIVNDLKPLELLVVPDSDTAGISGAAELMARVESQCNKNIRIFDVDLGEGFDVRDYCYDQKGKTEFTNYLKGLVRFNDEEQWDRDIREAAERAEAALYKEEADARSIREVKSTEREREARQPRGRQETRSLLDGGSTNAQ